MRVVRTVALTVVVLLLVSSQQVLGQGAGDGFDPSLKQPPWQRLGPIGPRTVSVVAVSPAWPRQRLLLAARIGSGSVPADLVRSFDGGQTWEALLSPAAPIRGLRLIVRADGSTVALAWSDAALFRSGDVGTSWQEVLRPDSGPISSLVVSPNIVQDGLVFMLAGGGLWRSADAAQTWTSLNPVDGQYVQQLRFSPDFANDHSLFVALAGSAFPTTTIGDLSATAPGGDPESSAGVQLSTDVGDSWTPLNQGLEVDGDAYQAVQELEPSATFASDGTLFAFAWGPFASISFGDRDVVAQRAALFRSQDRGQTWQPIQTFEPILGRIHLQVAPSPHFSDDNVVLEAVSSNGPTPASSHCSVAFSNDAGDTWTEKLRPGSYEGCQYLQTFGWDGGFEATVLKSFTRYWSPDGGQTWGLASSPSGFAPVVGSPAYAQDRTLFIGAQAGVWAVGPDVVETNGMLPCALSPVLGFGRLWSGNPDVRALLGCATDTERKALLRERDYVNQYCGPTRVLGIDDPGFADFYELSDSGCGPKTYMRWNKQQYASRLPDVPDQLIDAVVESFEGGTMLFVPKDDAHRTIVVLQPNSQWAEYADP